MGRRFRTTFAMHTNDVGERRNPAVATQLYQSGTVSLGRAASISGLSVREFINHLGGLGIDIVSTTDEASEEVADLSPWLPPDDTPPPTATSG